MAFWLAKERRGQAASYVQRFDPIYWTVNFPRPMMASVHATAANALRVECDFVNQGDMAGLIWESEDKWDHPLLAYETHKDYGHTILKFHWRSQGITPLDAANGPTLTIEGQDENGAERVWYVRLWNYAVGTPQDAVITLPFSRLESGWALPGERVNPVSIDRIFISLTPSDFVAGSSLPTAHGGACFAELTDISCDGEHAMLAIGDAFVPPHGEQIATGYDDAYNQTPTRLIRMIEALGYRGDILHYIGMSHFFALERDGDQLLAASDGRFTRSALAWHRDFLKQAQLAGYEVILSQSYELLADHCPENWQQRAWDGSPARTLWDPPSALLTPASPAANAWLKAVAIQLVDLLQDTGLPVKYQIGEPWWWVMPDGRPCVYDNDARGAFGPLLTEIADMRAPIEEGGLALLDKAGEFLEASTLALADAVRGHAAGKARIYLLLFTPTVLNPDMPELVRANVPDGWKFPAFDQLQLEDYDWLVEGADGLRRAAYAAMQRRLAYPISAQDYLAGFVLNARDKSEQWPRIDAALEDAKNRGVARRFVWALPQIARDGYTHFTLEEDTDMLAFDDVHYPLALGRDASVSPEFATTIALTASGHERRNSLWADARLHFDVGPGIRSEDELGVLIAFFRARRGAARGFRITDPFDFSSHAMTRPPTAMDQILGIGDGMATNFDLVKSYGEGDERQVRAITRPHPDSVMISLDGQIVSEGWRIQPLGKLEFDTPPAPGQVVRAGFTFDVPVRFAQDRLDVSGANFAAGEAPSVPLVEIRETR